jgi:flagellar basal-body rod protein FlgF
MSNAEYVGLSLQTALRRQMDVVANNVANISTTGFKGERVMFLEQLSQANAASPPGKNSLLSMVSDYGTYRDTTQGSFNETNNPLDIMLQGDGYLVVQTPQGERYTRAGSLQLNVDGQVCDMNGFPVQGEAGPIVIPQGDTKIKISPEGGISTESGQQGNFRIVRFAKDQFPVPAGGGTFTAPADQAPLPASDTIVKQFGVEASNVQPVKEMTSMIELQRAYETVQNLLDAENTRQRNAVDKLTNLNS